MLSLVVRKPHDVRLRSIATVVGCWTVGLPFIVHADKAMGFLGLAPMWGQLISHILMITGAYGAACFFQFSALDSRRADIRARRQALVLVVVAMVLIVAVVIMPADMRTPAATMTSGGNHPELGGVLSIGLFYATANCCLVYFFLAAAVSSGRCARRAQGGLRRALVIATVGTTVLVAAYSVLVVTNITFSTATGHVPDFMVIMAARVLLPGFALFFLGIGYPAAVTRVVAGRIWWRHLREYHALGPLWTALHAQFPEDALHRAPINLWLDRLRLTGVHRRFYRRVIECRDGLVRISPYIAHLRGDDTQIADTPAELARQLRQALSIRATGVDVPDRAVPIARPATGGFDADVHELLALAGALRPVGAAPR
ncbi:MAB_1171c family putative transporter [Nocardia terpenica]|uniref:MAB_1171c family putative transporter n=1 Tax=Nocardia terpenica TaxID=455432 RepID=UPI003D160F8E